MDISPVATPRARSTGTSARRTSRRGGRTIARKMSAPAVRRSHAVPAGPTVPIRFTERADPSCTESIAVIASAQGGIAESRSVARAGTTVGTSTGISFTTHLRLFPVLSGPDPA